MAHDYKVVKDTFEAAATAVNIPTVVTGYDKTIDSRLKPPVLQFDSTKSVYDIDREAEKYDIVADFLIYYNRNDPTETRDYPDVWREIENLMDSFFTEVNKSDQVRITATEVKKERFGYGFTVNDFIPVRVEFEITVFDAC